MKIFTVYDCKANAYLQPFFCRTRGEAIRAFSDCVNDINHNFSRHADEFTLFELGEYDEQSANISSSSPVSLGVAIEFKKAE